jgi:hypothetical protein
LDAEEMLRPTSSHVLLQFIEQSTSSIVPFPMTRHWIPVEMIDDSLWDMMTAANGFFITDQDFDEDVEKDESRRLRKTFTAAGGNTLAELLRKAPLKECLLKFNMTPTLNDAAYVIATGIISD